MTEPLTNTSIKSFAKIKGAPASAARYTPKYFDWGAEQKAPNPTAVKRNLFKVKDDINSPLKQMGINPQYMITLPCCEVNDLPNKRIVRGEGRPFNRSNVKAKPFTGLSRLAIVPKDRDIGFGIDLKQKPFTFSSWSSSVCS